MILMNSKNLLLLTSLMTVANMRTDNGIQPMHTTNVCRVNGVDCEVLSINEVPAGKYTEQTCTLRSFASWGWSAFNNALSNTIATYGPQAISAATDAIDALGNAVVTYSPQVVSATIGLAKNAAIHYVSNQAPIVYAIGQAIISTMQSTAQTESVSQISSATPTARTSRAERPAPVKRKSSSGRIKVAH